MAATKLHLDKAIRDADTSYKKFLEQKSSLRKLWYFGSARHCAKYAMRLAVAEELRVLTPAQTYVLGTICARAFLWWRPKRKQALDIFAAGLEHDPPPHMRAMLEVAQAEVYIECEHRETARSLVGEVVALAAAVRHESNKAHARIEYMKVLGRAFDLYRDLNDDDIILVQDLVLLFIREEKDPTLRDILRKIAQTTSVH